MAEMDQIGAAAGIGGIEMTDLEAEIIGHRHHPARGVAGAEIAVDIGLAQASVFERAFGDFGVKLGGGFIRGVPGWMLKDPGDIGLALDAQIVLRWRFLFIPFSRLSALPWQAVKYSAGRDGARSPPFQELDRKALGICGS